MNNASEAVEPVYAAAYERLPASRPGALTVVLVAPRWKLGRKSAALRGVEAAVGRWRRHSHGMMIVGQGAAASALRRFGADVVVGPASIAEQLSAVKAALEATRTDLNLFIDAKCEPAEGMLEDLRAALNEPGAAVAACLHPRQGPREFPLLCRRAALPLVSALLSLGEKSVVDLLRRPCARFIVR